MATKRQPSERTLDLSFFGSTVSLNYSDTWVAYSIIGLRFVMAWVFLQAGLEKLADGGFGEPLAWSSASFLNDAVHELNPLYGLFTWLGNYTALIDPLVIFGQVLIGLALFFGVFFRFAAMMGAIQMLFFWTAAWQGGLGAGLPVENGYVIDSSFVYLLLLFGLAAWGAGRLAGVDGKIEQSWFVQANPWVRYLLG